MPYKTLQKRPHPTLHHMSTDNVMCSWESKGQMALLRSPSSLWEQARQACVCPIVSSAPTPPPPSSPSKSDQTLDALSKDPCCKSWAVSHLWKVLIPLKQDCSRPCQQRSTRDEKWSESVSCSGVSDFLSTPQNVASVYGILQARLLEWIAFASQGDLPDPPHYIFYNIKIFLK